jgi:hypothetical protein
MLKRRSLPLLVLTVLVAALAATPSAMALPPATTHILSPADGIYALYNYETSAGTLSVSGSTTGTVSAVDIRCYQSIGNQYATLKGNVALDGSGNFTVTDVTLLPIASRNCLLVAVPTGTSPTIPDPSFTGIRLTVNETGHNFSNGHLVDYYDYAGQTEGSWGYDSIDSCGISYSQLNDVTNNFATTYVNNCNQYFTDYSPANAAPNISGMRINGASAYAADSFWTSGAGAGGGVPSLTHTFSVDPTTHDATITEISPFVTCPNGVSGLNGTNCATATDAGLVLNRVIHQNHNGLVTRLTDDFKNNTAAPMTLNMAYKQWLQMGTGGSPAQHFAVGFPNGTVANDATPYTSVAGPFASPSTVFYSDPSKADGDVTRGRGAITMYPGADGALFEDNHHFFLLYNRTIPAGGTLRIDASFAQAYGQAQLNALAAEANTTVTPQPTFGPKKKSSLKLDKKKKRLLYVSGQSVLCPATGLACSITGKLTAKVKLPAKKGSKKKAKYKTFTLGKLKRTRPPGSTTALKLTLGTDAIKVFKKYGKLNTTLVVNVTAGPYASASKTFVAKLKPPKFPAAKKH